MWDLATAGRWDEAREVYRWYTPLLHLDTHVKLVQYIKLAQQECGLGSEIVRAPRLPLVGEERERILAIIRHGDRDPPRERPESGESMNRLDDVPGAKRNVQRAAHLGDRHPYRRRADPRGDRGRA